MSDVASTPAVVDPQCSAKQERASWPAVFSLAFGAFGLVTAELLIGPRGVIVYACTAVVIGAVMMLTLGRAAERKRAAMAMQGEG